MAVRLRLTRIGCRNQPFYRVTAADSKSPRDGKQLEVLGHYNPRSGKDGVKIIGLKFDRVKYWLSVGAMPSEPVERLLFRSGLLPPMVVVGRKSGPRDKRSVDSMVGGVLNLDKPKSIGSESNVDELNAALENMSLSTSF